MNRTFGLTEFDIIEIEDDIITPDGIYSISLDHVIESAVIFVFCVTIMLGNALTIATIISLPGKSEVMDFYVVSLSFADLLVGLAVIPLSTVATSNLFPLHNYTFCSISGYAHVALSAVCMYTFMWMSVDRYLAVRKPLRYDTIQTKTRCKCWVLFTWIMAIFLCCPPLLGNSRGHFYEDTFMCLLDVSSMLPYSVTLGCLVLAPSVLTLCYTYSYIFSVSHGSTKENTEHNHSYHVTTFLLTVVFCLSWMPWGILKLLENLSCRSLTGHMLRFWLLWIGELHAMWTPIILISTSTRCQNGLRILCTSAWFNRNSSIPV